VKPKTVLVVDDEPGIRESLRDLLEDEGYAVELAANGREALELLPRLPRPFGIILDLIMPVMNGVEVYQAIRADPALADVPIVVSTSDPSRAPTDALVMRKPIDLNRLLSTIASLI
jgi:two-component system, sensor histidine kinase and response regulator